MGFFLEEVDSVEEKNEEAIVLEELDIVHNVVMICRNLESNERLVTRNILANKEGKVKVKGSGLTFKFPFLKQGYIVDIATHILEVKDPNSADGKYRHDIGIGGDIKSPSKITVKASEDPKYVAMLIKQRNTYINAIRNTAEQIMRALIRDQYQVNEELNKIDINQLRNIQEGLVVNMNDVLNGNTKISEKCSRQILKLSMDLSKNYGITLLGIDFPDIDLPQDIQNMISKSINESNQRKIDKAKADNDVYIAQQEAKASMLKRETEIEMLKKLKDGLGLSDEQFAQYLKLTAIPSNAVAFVGNENETAAGFIAANMVNKNQNSEGGRSK